nr:MAG TPA: hypothetical protein [Caudoviricetes sp.]
MNLIVNLMLISIMSTKNMWSASMKNIWNKRKRNWTNINAIYDILEIACVIVLISILTIPAIAIEFMFVKSMIEA